MTTRFGFVRRPTLILYVAAALCMLALEQCAVIKAPNGGPEDKTPPSLDSTSGPLHHTNFHEDHILLRFSEYVDKGKVMESVFLSPEKRLEFHWSGRECEITFPDGLDSNTTYALTLGTDYTDLHGNKPAQSYTEVFSTSANIDSASIRGELVDANPAGVFVYLYLLKGMSADTLDPRHTKARYRTQVGTNGQFSFQALPEGAYRVMAVRSSQKDGLYHPESDGFGTTVENVELSHSEQHSLNLRVNPPEDHTAPQLLDARPKNRQRVELQFSEPMDSSSIRSEAFRLEDSTKHIVATAVAAYLSTASAKNVTLLFPLQAISEGLSIRVRTDSAGPCDTARNHCDDSSCTATLQLSGTRDSLPPILLSSPIRDSALSVALLPDFRFVWNTAMDTSNISEHAGLFRDNRSVPCQLTWRSSAILSVRAKDSLQSAQWYELRLRTSGMHSYDSLPAQDSTLHLRFRTMDTRDYGVLMGVLSDSLDSEAVHILQLRSKGGVTRQIQLHGVGPFRFDNLPEGEYSLEAYCDSDRNGRYSAGTAFPYHPAERFAPPKTGLSVKARWTVDKVLVVIP